MQELDRRFRFCSRLCSMAVLFAMVVFWQAHASAARVIKSNATSVIVDLEGAEMMVGGKAYLLDGSAKKAIIQITKVQNGKALGKILKGSAQVGYEVQPSKSNTGGKTASSSRAARQRARDSNQMMVGGLLGYSMDSQSVKASNSAGTSSETVSMSGSGFSGKGLVDLAISGSLGLIGRFGAETFNLSGTSVGNICANGKSCTTSITYVSGDMLLRYAFMTGNFVPYASLGLGLHFPLSKSSNILDENQVSTTTIFFVGGGAYWKIGDRAFIPLHAEYGYFPPSNSVNTSAISLRVGYAVTM